MVTRVNFDTKGFAELEASLKTLAPELATKVGQVATRRAAIVVRDAARDAAPVGNDDTSRTYTVKGGAVRTADYGHLHDNIAVRKGKPRKAHTVVSFVTTRSAFWGRMLEFGTIKMGPQPWFGPAADGAAPQAYEAMVDALKRGFARAVKRSAKL